MSPLSELRQHLADFSDRCLSLHWLAARLHVGVAQDILEDEVKVHEQIGDAVYSAEQADQEAERLLTDVLADGRVTDAEIPQLRTALRHVRSSGRADHLAGEIARI